MMKFNILILDDEQLVCNSMKRILESNDRYVLTANNIQQADEILNKQKIDLLLLDYKLGQDDGISYLSALRERFDDLTVIMITAFGNIEIAVEAMKLGAYDFVQKKVEPRFLRFVVQRALDNLRLKKEVEELKSAFNQNHKLPEIIACSKEMQRVLQLSMEYANSDVNVLIEGETGTGKSLIAEFIHEKSNRFNQPFLVINCAAIPAELIESELFGYEKGAFTGASSSGKKGLIEEAQRGTLFLDEIAELNLDLQSKLLHILEKNEFYRLGATKPVKVDVRFIAASNTDLKAEVDRKEFRMDLYYRLNVAHIRIPPLRERKEDIIPLTKLSVETFNEKFNKSVKDIEPQVFNYLKSCYWQGNVRELQNYIERAMILKKDSHLKLQDFTENFFPKLESRNDNLIQLTLEPDQNKNLLHQIQRNLILHALEATNDNVTRAAQFLGIPRTSLSSCMKRFGITTNKCKANPSTD